MVTAVGPVVLQHRLRQPSSVRVVGCGTFGAIRTYAAKATAASTETEPTLSYTASKIAAKERRRKLYEASQERLERIKTRREGRVRGKQRREFRKWFIRKKVDEEYMNRKARQAELGWKHQVAVILTRTEVVLPDMEPWEEEYENLSAHLAQFGKEYPPEFGGRIKTDDQPIAMTQEELLKLLPEGFTPAPRETVADETGDVRTTDRKLKTSIYLMVQQDQDQWQFPTVDLNEDETILEAAERTLKDIIGPEVEYWCITNAPCAVDMEALPAESRTDVYGTKTFFMKIYYDEGSVNTSSLKAKDFAWLDRDEATERVQKDQGDYVAKFYHYLL